MTEPPEENRLEACPALRPSLDPAGRIVVHAMMPTADATEHGIATDHPIIGVTDDGLPTRRSAAAMGDDVMTSAERRGRGFGATWRDEWAEEVDVPQLRESWDAIDPADRELAIEGDPDSAYSPSERVYFLIDPDGSGDRAKARDFWAEIADTLDDPGQVDDPDLLRGFIEAALD